MRNEEKNAGLPKRKLKGRKGKETGAEEQPRQRVPNQRRWGYMNGAEKQPGEGSKVASKKEVRAQNGAK